MDFEEWRRWPDSTVVCMASGPSMLRADAEFCRGRARVITVNTTFRIAPWADVCYASDAGWIQAYRAELRDEFDGEVWHGSPSGYGDLGSVIALDRRAAGVIAEPGRIAGGMNSGAAALGLAYQFGARRIVMLGYDQQWCGKQARWHGMHPGVLRNNIPQFRRWAGWYQQAAQDFARLGIEVLNASRDTSLRCFRRVALEQAIEHAELLHS